MKKVTLLLSDAMEAEVDKLEKATDFPVETLFQKAFTLLRIHIKAAQRKARIIIEERRGISVIELPFPIRKGND